MAYKAKYILKRSVSSGTDEDAHAIVKAKFRFGDEVAPQDRETVGSRFKWIGYPGEDKLIAKYFQEVCGYKRLLGESYHKVYFSPSERLAETGINQVSIKTYRGRLGFDIRVKANKLLPLEEMLNLEEINNLILTGKMPEKTKDGTK